MQNDSWDIAALAILAPWFIYTGARRMFDPKYNQEMEVWAQKITAQADNKPFDRKKAEEETDTAHKYAGQLTIGRRVPSVWVSFS